MGDRTWSEIRFHVPDPVPEDLQAGVMDNFNQWKGADDGDHGPHLIPGALFHGQAEEANYGDFPDLEDVLKAHKIPYLKNWAQGGSYGPGEEYFDGKTTVSCATMDGEAIVDASPLRKIASKYRTGGSTLELIRELDAYLDLAAPEITWDDFLFEEEKENVRRAEERSSGTGAATDPGE